MHTEIKPGAYRQLFIDALAKYRQDAHPDERRVIDHYAALLRDPEYKFGKVSYPGSNFGCGELFFGS
jgi:hypothetical protein